jgi:hypothetical protein
VTCQDCNCRQDLTGQRFGRLVALHCAGKARPGAVMWMCKCDCGEEKLISSRNLRAGITKSCGCYQRDLARLNGERLRTHGMHRTTTHNVWSGMLQRCRDPKCKDYPRYGGAGIAVCERWLNFSNFLQDMGERPPGKTLDRWPDSNGNYEPGNCRWATPGEQARNSRAARIVTIGVRSQCLKDWCAELGIAYGTVTARLHAGWSEYAAIFTPINPNLRRSRLKGEELK